jgi:hypothetical protein
MATKGTRIIIGVFLFATLVGGGILWYVQGRGSQECQPLDSNTAKKIATDQKAGSVVPAQCSKPDPKSFEKISPSDNANQFEANYIIAKQLYKKGDKKRAAEVANTVLSSYRAMTQSESENIYGFAGKLADLDAMARGIY